MWKKKRRRGNRLFKAKYFPIKKHTHARLCVCVCVCVCVCARARACADSKSSICLSQITKLLKLNFISGWVFAPSMQNNAKLSIYNISKRITVFKTKYEFSSNSWNFCTWLKKSFKPAKNQSHRIIPLFVAWSSD